MSYAATQNGYSSSGGGNGGYGGGISISAAIRAFMRRLPLMAVIFFVLSALGWYMGSKIERTYSAEGRLLVQISDDYILQSSAGGQNNGGLSMTPDSIVLTEIGIITSPDLVDRVMTKLVGLERLSPETYAKYMAVKDSPGASNIGKARDLKTTMFKEFEDNLSVFARPKSSIVDVKFTHEDPQVALDTVNAILTEYQEFRRIVFVEGTADILGVQREATENQLKEVDAAIAAFFAKNRIGDFDSERAGSQKRTEDLRAEMNTLQANIRQTEAALASVENQLRTTEPTINLQVDDRASQRIAQAELERKQLLAKYLPTSDPVKAKEREIVELRELIASAGGKAVGGRRVGPNTVYQAAETSRNVFSAQADSYREKEFTLQKQLNAAAAMTAKLASLSPEYQNLLREKRSAETRLSTLNQREQDALVNEAQATKQSENVKIINTAKNPRKGRNMKKLVQFLSVVGAAFTALMIGLMGAFLDPSVHGAPTGMRRPNRQSGDDRDDGYAPIPEAVQPSYEPQPYSPEPYAPEPYNPQPAYAPAAAYQAGAHQAAAYDEYAYDTPAPYAPQNYGQASLETQEEQPNPYAAQPAQATLVPEGGAQPYDPALHGGGTQYVSGPNGTQVPVMGQSNYAS